MKTEVMKHIEAIIQTESRKRDIDELVDWAKSQRPGGDHEFSREQLELLSEAIAMLSKKTNADIEELYAQVCLDKRHPNARDL